MTTDIKNFYLCTPMTCFEYMQLKLSNLPDDVVRHYKLADKVTKDGYVTLKFGEACMASLKPGSSHRNC